MEKRVQEASSSNSSSSNSTQNWKFDVFLSFSGEDTRRGFTDHLYAALCRIGFKVFRDDTRRGFTDHLYAALCRIGFKAFRDDEELQRGEIISEELLKAIEGSRFAIVVLSENYASSSWCLVELQKILASRNEQVQQVIPIFYHVDPSDVRNQRGSFGEAFAKLEERFQDKEDVKKWRNSLTKVANLSGWNSKDWPEAKLIERVVEELWTNLCCRLPSYNDTIIGIDWRVHEMESHLGIGLDDVRFVGIWGLGGIGKTTLARVVYERFHNHFDFCCFLANVREASERDGLVQLQRNRSNTSLKCLPSALKVLQWSNYPLETPPPATQLDKLVDLKMRDSKIKQLWNKRQCMKNLKFLDLSHSKYLSQTPPSSTLPNLETLELEGCVDLAELHASLAQHKKLQVLNLKGCKNLKALPGKLEMTSLKEFVLEETNIEGLPSLEFLTSIEVLNLRGCKNLKFLPKLEMNSLKKIVLEATGIEEVPASLEFLSNIEVLNLRRCKNLKVLPRKLEMNSLKEFVLCGCIQVRNLPEFGENMKNLAILDVQKTGLVKLPESLGLLTGLQVLNLRACKNLQVLPRKLEMNSLKKFVLCGCTQLRNLPEFGEIMKNLVTLDVQETGLVKLPESLGLLTGLEVLNLRDCTNLRVLPRKLKMNSLKEFVLCGCTQVRNLPEFGDIMKNLVTLDVEETSIVKLPESLGLLTSLEVLNLKDCKNLVCLPHIIHNLKYLKIINISGCSKFSNLPENLNENEALEKLDASETAITEVPSSIGQLKKLKTLSFHSFPKGLILPTSIFNLKSLVELNLSYCNIDDGFIPDDIDGLSSLQKLDLSGNKLVNQSIFNLKSLIELNLSNCNIEDGFIPDDLSGLSSLLDLRLLGNNFVNLPPGCISNLLNLRYFNLEDCSRLQSLPQPSPHLDTMDASNCASLETLSSEQLLHLLASIDQVGQYLQYGRQFVVKRFQATIQGSEIPSWCEIQNYAWLNKKCEASIIIDVPPCEWFGLVLYTMLDSNNEMFSMRGDFVNAYNGEFEWFSSQGHWPSRSRNQQFPASLWIAYDQFRAEDGCDLSRYYSQCHLKCTTIRWKEKVDGTVPIKYGWRVIRKGDFEKWGKSMSESHLPILEEHKDGENEMCSEVKEQGQCSLSQFESSQTIINGCETMSPEASSPCLEEEGKLDDSWMQFIYDDARFWF